MQELLDRLGLILVVVGITLSINTYISFPTTINLNKKNHEITEQFGILENQISELASDVDKLKLLINKDSGSKIDVAETISVLNKDVSDLSLKYDEAMGILNGDNETLATVREVNVKYDLILKQLDSFKGDIARIEDKVFHNSSEQTGYLWGHYYSLQVSYSSMYVVKNS